MLGQPDVSVSDASMIAVLANEFNYHHGNVMLVR